MRNKKQFLSVLISVSICVLLVGLGVYATTTVGNDVTVGGILKADNLRTDEVTNHTVFVGDDAGVSSTGTYSTFVGEGAGESNSGKYSNALGESALSDNVGTSSNAFGNSALSFNEGNYSNAFGHASLQSNTGANSNAFGYYALANNTATNSNAFGGDALRRNRGANSNAFGHHTLYNNIGTYSNAFGDYALRDNAGNYNTAFGDNAFNTWTADTGNAKTVNSVTPNYTFTVNGHGFGEAGTYVSLKVTTTGALPVGLDGNAHQWEVIDANTIECKTGLFWSEGTGTHTVTPGVNYTNSAALGYNAEPDASNQIMLGDGNITQIKSTGSIYSSGTGNNYFGGTASFSKNVDLGDSVADDVVSMNALLKIGTISSISVPSCAPGLESSLVIMSDSNDCSAAPAGTHGDGVLCICKSNTWTVIMNY